MTRVVHVSIADTEPGACLGAYRLHSGLRGAGLDSRMFVARRHSSDETVVAYAPARGLLAKSGRLLRRRRIARDLERARAPGAPPGIFSDDRSQYGRDLLGQIPPGDIINLHWVAGLVDWGRFLRRFGGRVPLVWTTRDLNPFTGGCHVSLGCRRHTDGCGACPRLGSNRDHDLSRAVVLRKRRALARVPEGWLHIVAPSRWMADEARASAVFGGRPVRVIPHGIDTTVFAPRDRRVARELFGIPVNAKVVLFVASSLDRPVKGYRTVVEAVAGLEGTGAPVLVTVGEGDPGDAGPRRIHLGAMDDERTLALAYGAADVFVSAAMEEPFGYTSIESMACGTPVVGFGVGGLLDTVRHDETGLLVPPGDAGALREALGRLLYDDARREAMSAACRRVAVEEYGLGLQARRYAELYEGILADRRV